MTKPSNPAAVIYCPALNELEPAKVIDGVAQRLARTLDHHSDPVDTAYRVRTAAPEDYGTDGRAEVREILRIDAGKNPDTEGVVTHRVYGLDYLTLLDDPTADDNVLLKTWKMVCLCFTMSWRFVAACLLAESFSKKQKLSVFTGGIALLGVLIYAGLTIGTVARLAVDALEEPPQARASTPRTAEQANTTKGDKKPEVVAAPEEGADPVTATETAKKEQLVAAPGTAPGPVTATKEDKKAGDAPAPAGEWPWLEKAWDKLVAAPAVVWAAVKQGASELWAAFDSRWAKLIAVIGALGLSATGLRAWLDLNVTQSLRFCRYLEQGPARASCTGRFNALLEHVLSGEHARTDVVAYSLGSLVALDSLYPVKGNPNARVACVDSLTTIGCPFDFVRTFWDKYFDGRKAASDRLVWLNVYSPVDLLGSNFANDDGVVAPKRGINSSSRAEPKAAKETPAGTADEGGARPQKNLFYDPMGRQELKLIDTVSMAGFMAHTQYWVEDQFDAESCFQCFVPELYPKS